MAVYPDGQHLPGERLSVDKLAKYYGTSITPVRDVLQRLSAAGLVVIKPRSGYFVVGITLKHLRALLESSEILELASIERAGRYLRHSIWQRNQAAPLRGG